MIHYASRLDDLKASPGNRLEALSGDVKVINRIVNNRTSISAEMAVKLGSALGTSPEFWLNAQQAVDIYLAKRKVHDIPDRLIQGG